MFDTRSGFWLMASIGILALLATTAAIAFSSDDGLTDSASAITIGYPMTVVLPIIATLSVTSEWSQRSGLVTIVLANVLGLLVGFMLGVLIRSSAGAIVAYFAYSFLLPTISVLIAGSQAWFRNLQTWLDFKYAQVTLIDGTVATHQWEHLCDLVPVAVTSLAA